MLIILTSFHLVITNGVTTASSVSMKWQHWHYLCKCNINSLLVNCIICVPQVAANGVAIYFFMVFIFRLWFLSFKVIPCSDATTYLKTLQLINDDSTYPETPDLLLSITRYTRANARSSHAAQDWLSFKVVLNVLQTSESAALRLGQVVCVCVLFERNAGHTLLAYSGFC